MSKCYIYSLYWHIDMGILISVSLVFRPQATKRMWVVIKIWFMAGIVSIKHLLKG